MVRRFMDAAPWLSALGVFVMLVGLGWDGILHSRNPELASHEGVFTLTNPGHVLFAAGLALCVLATLYYLLVAPTQSPSLRTRNARLLCGAAALGLVVAAVAAVAFTSGMGAAHSDEHADTQAQTHAGGTNQLARLASQHASQGDPVSASTVPTTPVAGCEYAPIDLTKFGGADFQSPQVITSVNGIVHVPLTVTYTNPASTTIGGCPVTLRSYNGALIGPTLRVKQGETISVTLQNKLPLNTSVDQSDTEMPDDYNTTNLHTHGLHVSPVGNSDNVLLEIEPQTQFLFEIKVPPDHPVGTYWYHPHVHGSTAIQVSSSMEGALIIEPGDDKDAKPALNLDDVPEIKAAQEQVMVFQQIPYDESGQIESYDQFGPCQWEPMLREHTINGQLYPTLHMAPGEVQRWRFIHAGVRESIMAELHGPNPPVSDTTVITDVLNLPRQNLNEIALDGISLGKIDSWHQVELEPGYRSDVLVKVDQPGIYYLVDGQDDTPTGTGSLTCPRSPELPSLLARIVVDGPRKDMRLPDSSTLTATVPFTPLLQLNPQAPIVADNVGPNADPDDNNPKPAQGVTVNSFQRVTFTVSSHNHSPFEFLAAEHPFSLERKRTLKLDNVDEWILETADDSFYYAHPFHIHVNSFQTWRNGPNGAPELIWKDTLLVPQGQPQYVFTQYTDYIGQFVYHCHILDHEDGGMMELLDIEP